MAHIAVEREFSSKKRGAKLGDQLFRSIGTLAKPAFQITIKPRLVASPMGQFVKGDIVELIRAFECSKGWKADEVMARRIVGLAMTLSDVGAERIQELIGQCVTRVGVAHTAGLSLNDAIR